MFGSHLFLRSAGRTLTWLGRSLSTAHFIYGQTCFLSFFFFTELHNAHRNSYLPFLSPKRPSERGVLGPALEAMRARCNVVGFRDPGSVRSPTSRKRAKERGESASRRKQSKGRKKLLTSDHWIVSIPAGWIGVLAFPRLFKLWRPLCCRGERCKSKLPHNVIRSKVLAVVRHCSEQVQL